MPKNTPLTAIPTHDPFGDQLQGAVTQIAGQWNPAVNLREKEARAIQRALDMGKPDYVIARLIGVAKGKWVERQMKLQFPNLPWKSRGPDLTINGINYDVMSNTSRNRSLHANRMPHVLFRMLTF